MSTARKRRAPTLPFTVKAGDDVLLGGTYASYPGHWYFGTILWAGGEDILVERCTDQGQRWRQQDTIYAVRAVGTMSELSAIKEQARLAVKALTDAIHEAESALGAARGAMHAKLEELQKGGLKIAAYDRVADEACDAERREIQEQIETEQAATEAAHV